MSHKTVMLVCGLALVCLTAQSNGRDTNGDRSSTAELKRGKRMAPGRILGVEFAGPSVEETVYYDWPESKRAPNVFRWGKRAPNVFRWGKRAPNVFRWGKRTPNVFRWGKRDDTVHMPFRFGRETDEEMEY